MKSWIQLALVVIVAALAAAAQISFVSWSALSIGLDLVGLALVWWLVRRNYLAATLTAVIGGGLTDYLLGWRLMGHTFVWLLAVGLFILFGRRWLAAQTTSATWLNIVLVWFIIGFVRWLLSGAAWVSYSDQHLVLAGVIPQIVGRALIVGVMAAFWQRWRRRSVMQVTFGR